MATPNPPTSPIELPPLPPEPPPSVAPPEPVEPVEPAPPHEPLLPDPGYPIDPPVWDAVAPPPSRTKDPSVTRGAPDVDTGEVPMVDPLEAPSDAW